MPVSVVVGGQFGSEGKGKVALEITRRSEAPVTAVRVGGANSGHTAFSRSGQVWALRQLPAACIDLNVDVVFPAGSYIDVPLLLSEMRMVGFPSDRLHISEHANIVTEEHKRWEAAGGLIASIGSTGSGVGAAVLARTARGASNFPLRAVHACDVEPLQPYVTDTTILLEKKLRRGERIVIEGSQGYGLSLLDGGLWPKSTARTTTAAGALAEAGLSPRHVDDVTMVIRTFPIRVAGDSGALFGETTWQKIAQESGRVDDLREFTTVTKKLRRVGHFDASLVRRALAANGPDRVVLNHLDYVRAEERPRFVNQVEEAIGRRVDWLGMSGRDVHVRAETLV